MDLERSPQIPTVKETQSLGWLLSISPLNLSTISHPSVKLPPFCSDLLIRTAVINTLTDTRVYSLSPAAGLVTSLKCKSKHVTPCLKPSVAVQDQFLSPLPESTRPSMIQAHAYSSNLISCHLFLGPTAQGTLTAQTHKITNLLYLPRLCQASLNSSLSSYIISSTSNITPSQPS